MADLYRKLALSLSFLLFSSCVYSHSLYKSPPTKSFVKIFRQISVEECKDDKCPKEKWISSASGASVFISKKHSTVMTAGHICENIEKKKLKENVEKLKVEIVVLDHQKRYHEAKIILTSLEDDEKGTPDLCILDVPSLSVPKVYFSKWPARIGERIISMSAPLGVYHPPIVPVFLGIFSGDINNVASLATIPSLPGSSGAAVLNQRHRIVGVIYAVAVGNPNISLMVKHNKTLEFIQKVKKILLEDNTKSDGK